MFIVQFTNSLINCKLFLNPVLSRLCHVIYYHGGKKYPFLVEKGSIIYVVHSFHLVLCDKDIMYPKIQRRYSTVKNKLTFRNAFSIIRVSLLVITELLAKDNIV
jgi:hypothetical protein